VIGGGGAARAVPEQNITAAAKSAKKAFIVPVAPVGEEKSKQDTTDVNGSPGSVGRQR
jgi:hypothetical protein